MRSRPANLWIGRFEKHYKYRCCFNVSKIHSLYDLLLLIDVASRFGVNEICSSTFHVSKTPDLVVVVVI